MLGAAVVVGVMRRGRALLLVFLLVLFVLRSLVVLLGVDVVQVRVAIGKQVLARRERRMQTVTWHRPRRVDRCESGGQCPMRSERRSERTKLGSVEFDQMRI